MPKKRYFSPGSRIPIDVSWKMGWKNAEVKVNEQPAFQFATKKDFQAGNVATMPDGSTLQVRLGSSALSGDQLHVEVNGEPVEGSAGDVTTSIRGGAGVLLFIGALNIILGVIAMVAKVQALLNLGMGIGSLLVGVVYLVLGGFAWKRSRVAMGLGLVFFVVDSLLGIVMTGEANGIILRIIFLIAIGQGLKGAIDYHKKEA